MSEYLCKVNNFRNKHWILSKHNNLVQRVDESNHATLFYSLINFIFSILMTIWSPLEWDYFEDNICVINYVDAMSDNFNCRRRLNYCVFAFFGFIAIIIHLTVHSRYRRQLLSIR